MYAKIGWIIAMEGARNLRRRVWNKRIRIWWYRIFIRKDEFHPSLNMDIEAIMVMGEKERKDYYKELGRRRKVAHERDLGN